MKKSGTLKTIVSAAILLFALIPFLFTSSCQKEELIMDSDSFSIIELKSGTISADGIDELILKIENYVTNGDLKPGIANSFLVKLKNANKSLEKGNEKAATNKLNALLNQLEGLISGGTVDASIGGGLILDIQEITVEWTCGQPFVDYRDGKVYQTVKIGEQCWIAENLAYLPEVYPCDSESYTEQRYYVYDYQGTDVAAAKQQANYTTYGVLYNWPAAMEACPGGWHLPSDAEWEQLAQYISDKMGPYEKNSENDWEEVGTHLKTTSGWELNGNGTDDFGFSALPGGHRHRNPNAYFHGIGYGGPCWSITEVYSNYALCRSVYCGSSSFHWGIEAKITGFSVRCIRD